MISCPAACYLLLFVLTAVSDTAIHLLLPHDNDRKLDNSLDKLRHPRSVAYSAEQVLINKQQIWCGGAYPDCYRKLRSVRTTVCLKMWNL